MASTINIDDHLKKQSVSDAKEKEAFRSTLGGVLELRRETTEDYQRVYNERTALAPHLFFLNFRSTVPGWFTSTSAFLRTFVLLVSSFPLSILTLYAHGFSDTLSSFLGAQLQIPSDVALLTEENFDTMIGEGRLKGALVQFYKPECDSSICNQLGIEYEELAHKYNHAKKQILIGRINMAEDEGRKLAERFGITESPSFRWFDGEAKISEYVGDLNIESWINFITRKTGIKSNLPTPPHSDVIYLDKATFNNLVLDPRKHVAVLYTTQWCGHCMILHPIYEKLATAFEPEQDCIISSLVVDEEKHKGILETHEIRGYPVIKFYPKGADKTPDIYSGENTEEELFKWFNKKCGTKRTTAGLLNGSAGRIPELDTLASKFYTGEEVDRETILAEARGVSSKVGPAGQVYITIMEKVKNGSSAYIAKEMKRLQAILEKKEKRKEFSRKKLDEFKIKLNVLESFIVGSDGKKPKTERSTSEL